MLKLVDEIQGRLSYKYCISTLTLALNKIRIINKTSENWGGATQWSVEQWGEHHSAFLLKCNQSAVFQLNLIEFDVKFWTTLAPGEIDACLTFEKLKSSLKNCNFQIFV